MAAVKVVAGVKAKSLEAVVAGVNSNLLALVLGVEYFVNGVSFSFATGDQFSSPSFQLSLSGLDLMAFDMPSRFAFCDVRSGEGV